MWVLPSSPLGWTSVLGTLLVCTEEVFMLRTLLFVILLLGLVPVALAQTPGEEFLPAGTILHCTLDEPNFSSRTAEVGDPILCHTGTLPALGRSLSYRGADLSGHFQDYRDPGHFVGKGWMDLEFYRLVLPGGVTLPLSAKVISVTHFRVDREGKIHGGGHPKRDAVEWAVPVLWPEKVLTLPARGPRPTLKHEVRMTLRLLEDVGVPTTGVVSRAFPAVGGSPRLRPSSSDLSPTYQLVPSSNFPARLSMVGDAATASDHGEVLRVDSRDHNPEHFTPLILKGGGGYLARDYWVEAGVLHLVTTAGEHKIFPVSELDLEETVRLNRERNTDFVLRTPEANLPIN